MGLISLPIRLYLLLRGKRMLFKRTFQHIKCFSKPGRYRACRIYSQSFRIWFLNNKNKIKHIISNKFPLFLENRKKYFSILRIPAVINAVDILAPELFKTNGKKILDMGCGYGDYVALFNGMGHSAVGTITERNADDFIFVMNELDIPHVIHDATSSPLPFPDNSFDVVWSVNVLPLKGFQGHIDFVLSEIHRVLKLGGYVAIRVIAKYLPLFGYGSPQDLMPENCQLIFESSPYVSWRKNS